MKIRIKETRELKDLTIIGDNGIEWTHDLITAVDFWNRETEEHEMSQSDYDWWSNWIETDNEDQEEIKELVADLNIDVDIIKNMVNKYYSELNNQHETIQWVLKNVREEYVD